MCRRVGVALALDALAGARLADLLAFANAAPGALVVERTRVAPDHLILALGDVEIVPIGLRA